MVPAPARRCLSAVHSADMAGTPAGSTEVWGGALSNGSLVLALCNRDAPNATVVDAPLSLLLEHNAFFSCAQPIAPPALTVLDLGHHTASIIIGTHYTYTNA